MAILILIAVASACFLLLGLNWWARRADENEANLRNVRESIQRAEDETPPAA